MGVFQRDFDGKFNSLTNVLEAFVSEPYYVFLLGNNQGYKTRVAFLYDILQNKIKILGFK